LLEGFKITKILSQEIEDHHFIIANHFFDLLNSRAGQFLFSESIDPAVVSEK